MVVPVPLGVAREAQRGYNQAAMIARPLALSERLRYQPDALRKIKATRTQVGLSRAERLDSREPHAAQADKGVHGEMEAPR